MVKCSICDTNTEAHVDTLFFHSQEKQPSGHQVSVDIRQNLRKGFGIVAGFEQEEEDEEEEELALPPLLPGVEELEEEEQEQEEEDENASGSDQNDNQNANVNTNANPHTCK